MTIAYTRDLVTIKWWSFFRVLLRWRGSIYKLILPDLLVFICLFAIFSLTYRFGMPPHMRDGFERFCVYCSQFENLIPVVFILGFFVQLIVSRWTEQSHAIPYPDSLAFYLNVYVGGEETAPKSKGKESAQISGPSRPAKCHVDGGLGSERSERALLVRRNVMRYANLSIAAAFRRISYSVKKKIPNEEDFVRLQLMTKDELEIWNAFPVENKYFLPLSWAAKVLTDARSEGLISSDYHLKILLEATDSLRGKIGMLFFYDFISPPLAYTQATTICVYSFFLATLFGRQFLHPPEKFDHVLVDAYLPIFTIFQFIFYVGWLKVAEELINPYGKDDEDLDILYFIRRNLEITGVLVGVIAPKSASQEDHKWDTVDSAIVPKGDWATGLTVSAGKGTPFKGSTSDLRVRGEHRSTSRQTSGHSHDSGSRSLGPRTPSLSQDVERGPESLELVDRSEKQKELSDSKKTDQTPLISMTSSEPGPSNPSDSELTVT